MHARIHRMAQFITPEWTHLVGSSGASRGKDDGHRSEGEEGAKFGKWLVEERFQTQNRKRDTPTGERWMFLGWRVGGKGQREREAQHKYSPDAHELSPGALELIKGSWAPQDRLKSCSRGRAGSVSRGTPSMLGTPAPTCGIRVSFPK